MSHFLFLCSSVKPLKINQNKRLKNFFALIKFINKVKTAHFSVYISERSFVVQCIPRFIACQRIIAYITERSRVYLSGTLYKNYSDKLQSFFGFDKQNVSHSLQQLVQPSGSKEDRRKPTSSAILTTTSTWVHLIPSYSNMGNEHKWSWGRWEVAYKQNFKFPCFYVI